MAGKKWSAEEDKFVRENTGYLTAEEIAAVVGRTTRSVHHRRKALGIRIPPSITGRMQTDRWGAELESRLGEPVCVWLRRRYEDEGASYRELCAEAGINTRSVIRLMRECNITPISPSEALQRQIDRNPDFLQPFIAGGQTETALRNRAKTHERTLGRMSDDERRFLEVLQSHGFAPVPQLAVLSYNIDFAFPEVKLAVEWDPRWHNSPIKRPVDRRRERRLTALGWTVLHLDSRTSDETNVRKVSDALKSLASTHPR